MCSAVCAAVRNLFIFSYAEHSHSHTRKTDMTVAAVAQQQSQRNWNVAIYEYIGTFFFYISIPSVFYVISIFSGSFS